jgi:hypothetical protein
MSAALREKWAQEDKQASKNTLPNRIMTGLGDFGLSAAQGVVGLGQAEVGLADLATGGYAGKLLEKVGYRPQDEQSFVNDLHSDAFKASQAAVQQAQEAGSKGTFVDQAADTLGAVANNPYYLLTGVIPESLPMMAPGIKASQAVIQGATKGLTGEAAQVAAKAAMPKAVGAASASEGLITSGQIADQAQSSGREWSDYAAPALQAGAATAGISALSGRLLGDVDTAVGARLAGVEGNQFKGGLLNRAAKGFATEGFAEEAPQSAQEAWQTNRAMGEADLMKGVASQAVMGGLAGGVTGGVMAGLSGGNGRNASTTNEQALLTAPTQDAKLSPPVQDSPLSRAAAQGGLTAPPQEQSSPLTRALPALPADEVITFGDGSQARQSEVLQQLTAAGHSAEQAQAIVANLATQAKPAPQPVQTAGQVELPDYVNLLSANTEKSDPINPTQYAVQNFANGLLQNSKQGAVDGLTQEKLPLDLISEAKQAEQDKIKQASIAQKQAEPIVNNDDGRSFDTRKEAEAYQQQFSLDATHTVMPNYGSYVLAHKGMTPAAIDAAIRSKPAMPKQSFQDKDKQSFQDKVLLAPIEQTKPAQVSPLLEPIAATAPQSTTAPRQPQAIKPDDDLVTAIAKLGGLSSEQATAQGIDPAALNTKARVFGKANVFTKNGRTYDDLAETLAGQGFEIADANDLVAKVSGAINQGEKIYTPQGKDIQAERELSQQYDERYQQDNNEQSTNKTAQATAQEVKPARELTFDQKRDIANKQVNGLNEAQVKAVSEKLLIRPDSEGNYSLDKIKREHPDDISAAIGEIEQQASGYDASIPFRKAVGKQEASGMVVADVQKIADDFMGYYNGNIPLDLLIRNTQEEIYGKNATIENEGVIKGGYHAKNRVVTLAAANLQGERDAVSTLRHEVLGHYGLNTFAPSDKESLLRKILNSKNHKLLKDAWARIDALYPEVSELKKAEEVFAFIAESEQGFIGSIRDFVHTWLNRALRAAGLINAPITTPELRDLVRSIAKGIRNGQRTQQNFPASDEAQFSKESGKVTKDQDKLYLDALQNGDMERAQQLVNEAAEQKGYGQTDYQMSHKAPHSKSDVSAALDNLEAVYPEDIYSRQATNYYGDGFSYDGQAVRAMQAAKGQPDKMITIYRAMPKSVKESKIRNGDWITLTRAYAKEHGESHLSEGFKIVEDQVPASHIFTDGNSIHEFGYDDGNNYAYASTKNNRKLADAVTYDDNGEIIPLSKRFNSRNADPRYSVPQSKTTNAHTQASLTTALRTTLDKPFGKGFFERLMATGKVKVIDRTQAGALGANPNAQTFFNPKDDTTYFVADNIDKGTNLVKLALHEIGIHALQLGKNSAAFKAILKQVENLTNQRNPSKAVKAAIKAAQDANTPAHLFLEEVAGYLVENHPDLNVSQKIITWFKAMLRKLGVRIAMNDADIVTMATAALRTAPDSLLFDGDVQGELRDSVNSLFKPITEQAEQFRKALSSLMASKKTLVPTISIGKPSTVLSAVGLPNLPIKISRDTIRKATNGVKHDVPMSVIESLPEILANPVMVFDSVTEKNSLVVLSDYKDESGRSIMIALHMQTKEGRAEVNKIGSVYGRGDSYFTDLVKQGHARYINEEKSRAWLRPIEGTMLQGGTSKQDSKQKYITNHDLINGKNNDLRYSLSRKIAAWTASRVKWLLNAYAYEIEPSKTKAFAVYVDPNDFINATTTPSSLSQLEKEVGKLDQNRLLNESQPIFLQGNLSGFQTEFSIKQHEGRHRMIALRNAGITQVPIVIEIQSAMTLDYLDDLIIRGQSFESGAGKNFKAQYLTPISLEYKDSLVDEFEDNGSQDIRYSIASTATDYFTEQPRRARTLADRYAMLDTGKQPSDKIGWQHYFDKVVTTFTDSTRPFARFVQDTFDAEHASALLSGADRALGMKAAYEKEAMGLFGNRVADGIRAIEKVLAEKYPTISRSERYKTAKDIAGDWMTVSYAPDANDWLMQKDQDAIDALESEILKATDPEVLKVLNKKLVKAKDAQQARIDAINDPAIIDPTQQKQDAGLAGGFNNATAADLKARIEAKIPLALLEATAKPIYEMNAWKLKRDIADNKISQATADKFPKYAHYVPLTGDPRTDDSVDDHFSTGSVNQAKDKALGGRTGSIAQNGIDASFEQLEKSARYHGWNDFKTALANTYDDLIAEKMATGLTQKQAEQAVWDERYIKRRVEAGMIPAGENDITVRKDGKGFIYTIDNQGAMEALRSVNDEPTPSILKPIAALTRLQARMVTQFMPLFAPTNMIRDVAERSENIRTRVIVGHEGLDMNKIARQAIGHSVGLLAHIKPIMAGVLAENTHLETLFKVDDTNADVKMLKRFLALGGSSTYGDYISGDSKSLADKLRKAGSLSDEAMEVVELWNNSFETISGFSIYKALVENGVSDEKAATASLNLMNFRKRGKVMSPLRALYMFAQPIATGGHNMVMTLATRRGKVRFAAYTVASMFIYALLRAGDDDEELGVNRMDEQGNFTLYRNILIPMGGGRYFKVPVGFGMQQLAWAHGVNNIRMMLGEMTAAEGLAESQALWARSAMPVAPSETAMWKNPAVWFAQTFTPQIAKPIANIAMDRNAFGAPLTNARYEQQDKARSLQGRRDTPPIYKEVAQFFARNGMDIYPEQVREIMRGYGAGVGNELLKWQVENPAKEARGLSTVSPLIDRYVLQSNDDSLRQRLYFRLRDSMNEINARESTGGILSPEEKRLADLGDVLKKKEAQQRGKVAAATKAERDGNTEKAKNLRVMAERMRVEYINYALTQRGGIA